MPWRCWCVQQEDTVCSHTWKESCRNPAGIYRNYRNSDSCKQPKNRNLGDAHKYRFLWKKSQEKESTGFQRKSFFLYFSPKQFLCKKGICNLAFNKKTLSACKMCISCFLLKNNLVHRVAVTHTVWCPPEHVTKEAKSYITLVVPKCVGFTYDKSKRFTNNMDQTNN